MPLARIDLIQGKSAEYRRTVGDIVYEAMVEALKAPKTTVSSHREHPIGALVADENYLAFDALKMHLIQLTLNAGRTVEQRKPSTRRGRRSPCRLGFVRDVFINLIEVQKENWSFGNGIAQYAE